MNVVLFCHSLLSDWNHGNAHFLRGVASELIRRGHAVDAYEPEDAWSVRNLLRERAERNGRGVEALRDELRRRYPGLVPIRYRLEELDLERALDGADVVLVHEWNDPVLVRRVGRHRAGSGGYRLLFHDSHHRSVTEPEALERFDLEAYDGVLAFGDAVRAVYERRGWGRRAWTWREAADVHLFRPDAPADGGPGGDLVWIGNWGDEERTRELHDYLLEPIRALGLTSTIHGVRYPPEALRAVHRTGARYRGWVANYRVPGVMRGFRMTVHVPRRPYLGALRDVPTIRPFEALACSIPLVSARWDDPEGLFRAGEDFLVARHPDEMRVHLRTLAEDPALRRRLAREGRRTIVKRHTCAHRVDELLDILAELRAPAPRPGSRGRDAPASGDAPASDGAPASDRTAASEESPRPRGTSRPAVRATFQPTEEG